MGVERVDYSSDEEYKQALQHEYFEYQEQQAQYEEDRMLNDCGADLKVIVDRYGLSVVEHCIGAFKNNISANEKKEEPKEMDSDDDIPF